MPSENKTRRGERGYVLLVFILLSAILAVGLLRMLPKAAFQGQREKEEELIFRGLQYQLGIQKFVRKFGRYPNTMEEIEKANEIRFLRKRYRDPMTKEGEWRLLHMGPGGIIIDSINVKTPLSPLGTAASGTTSSQTSPTSSGSSATPTTATGFSAGAGGTSTSVGLQPAGQTPPALSPSANPGANPAQQPRAAGTQEKPPIFGGSGIAGVASMSEADSIKVYRGFRKHNEWEFIYDYRYDNLGAEAVARMTAPAQGQQQVPPQGQQPQQPATGQQPRGPGLPPSPFGQAPGIVGPAPGFGQRPGQPPAFPGPGTLPPQPQR